MIVPKTTEETVADCCYTITTDEYNKRIRIDDYSGNVETVMLAAETKTMQLNGEKLIMKAKQTEIDFFLSNGYVLEGIVEHYFLGQPMYFVCKYFKSARRNSWTWREEDETLQAILTSPRTVSVTSTPNYKLLVCTEHEAEKLASFYASIFNVYPVPIFDPAYIKKCMQGGNLFLAYLHEDKIISAVCAEMNVPYRNAEITDCATLPDYRKFKLMQDLINKLEGELIKKTFPASIPSHEQNHTA